VSYESDRDFVALFETFVTAYALVISADVPVLGAGLATARRLGPKVSRR
jgi:hypothetical protein